MNEQGSFEGDGFDAKLDIKLKPVISEMSFGRNEDGFKDSIKLAFQSVLIPLPSTIIRMAWPAVKVTVVGIGISLVTAFMAAVGIVLAISMSTLYFCAGLLGFLRWTPGQESAQRAILDLMKDAEARAEEQGEELSSVEITAFSPKSEDDEE
tara:strand:- start:424 stop:879 length:456 start_codon:yes stop_codon:yes gene_type:complete